MHTRAHRLPLLKHLKLTLEYSGVPQTPASKDSNSPPFRTKNSILTENRNEVKRRSLSVSTRVTIPKTSPHSAMLTATQDPRFSVPVKKRVEVFAIDEVKSKTFLTRFFHLIPPTSTAKKIVLNSRSRNQSLNQINTDRCRCRSIKMNDKVSSASGYKSHQLCIGGGRTTIFSKIKGLSPSWALTQTLG